MGEREREREKCEREQREKAREKEREKEREKTRENERASEREHHRKIAHLQPCCAPKKTTAADTQATVSLGWTREEQLTQFTRNYPAHTSKSQTKRSQPLFFFVLAATLNHSCCCCCC